MARLGNARGSAPARIRRGRQDVKQEPGGWIGFIRVDALARGDKPDTMCLEFLKENSDRGGTATLH